MDKEKAEVEVVFNSTGKPRKFTIKRGWHRMKFKPEEAEHLIKSLKVIKEHEDLCK